MCRVRRKASLADGVTGRQRTAGNKWGTRSCSGRADRVRYMEGPVPWMVSGAGLTGATQMPTAEANDLITEVTRLPVQPGAAMRLLWMREDPRTSAADLGRLIESDPALSAQVIRLAKTPFYGPPGKVPGRGGAG